MYHARNPGKGVDISIVALAKNAYFALRCMRHPPPHRASRISREANTRIYLVLRVLLEIFLSRTPSQRHCTAPICIPEVGLRDFQSRHLRYLPVQKTSNRWKTLLPRCYYSVQFHVEDTAFVRGRSGGGRVVSVAPPKHRATGVDDE